MITWDDHHRQKWAHFLTGHGTWQRRKKMKGKKLIINSLRETYHNPRFHDPHPDGKADRTIGPPLNNLFVTDDYSGAMPAGLRFVAERVLAKDKCYPGTNIPLSTDGIQFGSWKEEHPHNPSAKRVVGDFLAGLMANTTFVRYHVRQLDRIESAFFELGWRVNRHALLQANNDMRDGKAANAFGSTAWRQAPPLRVDQFKGEEIEKLMNNMRQRVPAGNDNGDENIADNDDNLSDDDHLPLKSKNKKSSAGRKSAWLARVDVESVKDESSSDEDGYDDDDDDDDDDLLFVGQRRRPSPVVARPSSSRNSLRRDADEELAHLFAMEEESEARAEAGVRVDVEARAEAIESVLHRTSSYF